ncbi:hypothetical protein ACLQ2P_10020 [Actinomadura citrea]|uniref:hypothetical protein n=1 Tax=Actinomadura citrea TaxID=46158 RepID=UPI002E2BF5DF|nr:hypothetical protein [Actinomadura citrea]
MLRTKGASTEAGIEDDGQVFRKVRFLVGCYVALSVLTVVGIGVLSGRGDDPGDAVWTRAVIVVLSSLLTLRFTVRAARGGRRDYLRLRIASAVMLVAIVVIVSLPGAFPVWLRIEQGVCGLLLLGVVVLVNGGRTRALFG